jgi:hypothetical protein
LQGSYIRWAHPRTFSEKKEVCFAENQKRNIAPLSGRRGAGGEVKREIEKTRHCEQSEAISLKSIFFPTETYFIQTRKTNQEGTDNHA